jgi:hypothetical protein
MIGLFIKEEVVGGAVDRRKRALREFVSRSRLPEVDAVVSCSV